MPNGAYSGQKLTNDVSANTTATTNNTMPNVPEIVPVKYSTPNTTATIKRMMRSVEPMFFFILFGFEIYNSRNVDHVKKPNCNMQHTNFFKPTAVGIASCLPRPHNPKAWAAAIGQMAPYPLHGQQHIVTLLVVL